MTTTLVTVLYEGADVLEKTMPTWAASCRTAGCAVLFIDNSPTSAARAVVQGQNWGHCAVRFISDPANPGFAASANRAVREAMTDSVFLLNADVFLTSGALRMALDSPSSAEPIAVSLITGGERTLGVSIDRCGYFSDRRAHGDSSCLGPSGGAAIFDRQAFLALGGFDADLFAWGEDAGLALRLWSAGVRTKGLDLGLIHVGGHSVASLAGLRRKARLLARNRIIIIRRQYSLPLTLTVGVLQFGVILLNGLRKIPQRTSGAHFAGVIDALALRVDRLDRSRRFDLGDYRSYRAASHRGPRTSR